MSLKGPRLCPFATAGCASASDRPTVANVKLEVAFASRSTCGFAVHAARLWYRRYRVSGVALPGLDPASNKPPSLRMLATSSAQKKLVRSVCLGQRMDLAMPVFEKGLPTHSRFANLSIFCTAACEQPRLWYSYCGFLPVRSTSSCASTPSACVQSSKAFV